MIFSLLARHKTSKRASVVARKQKTADYSPLEPRNLLATFTVDTVIDNGAVPDGLISLREAVVAANTNAPFGDASGGTFGLDEIVFDASLDGQVIPINGTAIPVIEAVEIRGNGVGVTLDGANQSRLFDVNTDQEVVISGLNFVNGNAQKGGAILMEGGGTLRLTSNDFISNGEVFETEQGGAIYNNASTVLVLDSTFTANFADEGGAIYSEGGTMNLIGSTFEDNKSTVNGGAVSLFGGTYFVSQSDFTGNSANEFLTRSGGRGGAIWAGGTDTTTLIYDSSFDNNQAGSGGGIFNGLDNVLVVRNTSTFTANEAHGLQNPNGTLPPTGKGGAIYNAGTARVLDSSISNNTAAIGGGFYSRLGNATLSRTEISANTAFESGGGIAFEGGAVLVLDSTVGGDEAADGNTANLTNGLLGDTGSGGGIAVLESEDVDKPGILRFVGGEIGYNTARFTGGGIFNSTGSFLNLFNGTVIYGNSTIVTQDDVVRPRGGGIYNSGVVNLNDVAIVENSTEGSGGGIYMNSGFLRSGYSVISANQANASGGGINMDGGQARLFQSIVGGLTREEGNVAGTFGAGGADGSGGGVYVSGTDSARFRMIGGYVSHNTATLSGGGIYQSSENTVLLENFVYVDFNRALRQDGGGIFNNGGHLELRDSVFADNSSRNGGGIFNGSGTAVLTGSNVQFNEARLAGGGIFNEGEFFRNSTFINSNTAAENPDIFNEPQV
ncbi:MAG: hypothetical protein AAF456_11590 [Planctomycetota bacterium]